MQDELYVRVKQALTWLKRNKGILQKDIADKMGMAEASFTRGLARIKEKRDEGFVIKFHSAVSEYISIDYLLHGDGTLTIEEGETTVHAPMEQIAGIPDMSSVMNSALAKSDEIIEQLKQRIKEKDKIIAEKDERIAELKDHNRDLRQKLNKYENSDIDRYPFPVGAADGEKRKTTIK